MAMTAAVLRPVVRRRRFLPRARCPGSMTGVASLPMSTPGRRRASTVGQPGRPAAGSNSPAPTGRRAQLTRRPVAPDIATPGPLRSRVTDTGWEERPAAVWASYGRRWRPDCPGEGRGRAGGAAGLSGRVAAPRGDLAGRLAADTGRGRKAVAHTLTALAPHLPRCQRSVTN